MKYHKHYLLTAQFRRDREGFDYYSKLVCFEVMDITRDICLILQKKFKKRQADMELDGGREGVRDLLSAPPSHT